MSGAFCEEVSGFGVGMDISYIGWRRGHGLCTPMIVVVGIQ